MRLIERRIGLLFSVFLLLLVIAVVRAAWLGTVQADDLRSRASTQQVEDLTVPARRGTITDRHGTELAVSEDATTVFANPFLIDDPNATARRLAPIVGIKQRRAPEEALRPQHRLRLPEAKARRRRGRAGEEAPDRGDRHDLRAAQAVPAGFARGAAARHRGDRQHRPRGPRAGARVEAPRRGRQAPGSSRTPSASRYGSPTRSRRRRARSVRLTIDTAIQERAEAVLAEVGHRLQAEGRERDRDGPAQRRDPRARELAADQPQ